ncbi:MAG: PAS domain-containing protein, partial [bacterium]
LLGFTPGEIQSMGESMLQDLCHPEDWKGLQNYAIKIQNATDDEVLAYQCRLRNKKGEWHWVHMRSVVFSRSAEGRIQQVLGVMRDITEAKQLEEQFQIGFRSIKMLLEGSENCLYLHDLEGRYLYFYAPQKYGFPEREMIGKTPHDIFPEEYASALMEQIGKVVQTGEKMLVKSRLEWKDQTLQFIDDVYPVKDSQGNVIAVGRVCLNITDRAVATE